MKNTLFICSFLLIAQWSLACDCSTPIFTKEVRKSHYILVGKVIAKKLVSSPQKGDYPHHLYKIQVSYYYKGRGTKKTITLRSGVGGGDCGFPFELGKSYLIFGNLKQKDGVVHTNICRRTKALEETKDLEKLDKMLTKQKPK